MMLLQNDNTNTGVDGVSIADATSMWFLLMLLQCCYLADAINVATDATDAAAAAAVDWFYLILVMI